MEWGGSENNVGGPDNQQENENPLLQRLLASVEHLERQNADQLRRSQEAEAREQELLRKLAELGDNPQRQEDVRPALGGFHPFAEDIQRVQIPRHFREPVIKPYDGTRDPQAHVAAFQT